MWDSVSPFKKKESVMIEERNSERRGKMDRRMTKGRRVRNEEWLPVYEVRGVRNRDRRMSSRRGLDRRRPM